MGCAFVGACLPLCACPNSFSLSLSFFFFFCLWLFLSAPGFRSLSSDMLFAGQGCPSSRPRPGARITVAPLSLLPTHTHLDQQNLRGPYHIRSVHFYDQSHSCMFFLREPRRAAPRRARRIIVCRSIVREGEAPREAFLVMLCATNFVQPPSVAPEPSCPFHLVPPGFRMNTSSGVQEPLAAVSMFSLASLDLGLLPGWNTSLHTSPECPENTWGLDSGDASRG